MHDEYIPRQYWISLGDVTGLREDDALTSSASETTPLRSPHNLIHLGANMRNHQVVCRVIDCVSS